MDTYWSKVNLARLSRRRSLALTGIGAAVAGLMLAGCGGSDRGSTSTKDEGSSLLTKPEDRTDKAVKGGVYPGSLAVDIQSFDFSVSGTSSDATASSFAHSRLVKFQTYKYPTPVKTVVEADAATSWEISPDGLQYTYKLRPNMKFDSRAPTNGRALNASDVKFSWDRFAKLSSLRNVLANATDPGAPITSVEATDSQTVVIKLAFPYAPLNTMLAYYRYLQILPVEADGKYDVRQDMRGSAAWRLKSYARSQKIEYEKNPDWYDAPKVNFDTLSFPIVTEYATALAQFRTGNIGTYAVKAEDILSAKRDIPALKMMAEEEFSLGGSQLRFSYLPNSPFLDDRVRRAASMLLDRDLVIDAFENLSEFEKAGLHAPVRWNSSIPSGWDDFWIDPKNNAKELGEGASSYQFNAAEAKKLMSAAGHKAALETQFVYPPGQWGSAWEKQAEVIRVMLEEKGDFKLKTVTLNYPTEFRPKYFQGSDKHEGIAFMDSAPYPDVDGWLWNWYRSGGERSGHLGPDGKPDAKLDDLVAKQRGEADLQKRQAIIKDIQRYAATKMYVIHNPGDAVGFQLAWPWLANWNVYRARTGGAPWQETLYQQWFDASKKT